MPVSESGRGAAREYAVVIRGGRVVDPGQDLDAARDLALEGGVIAPVGTDLRGRVVLHAAGCVVAPGFIDLHSHSQSVGGHRLQAFDGVTTTLELEAGAIPVAEAYARAEAEGRPLNYGYSASWAAARIQVLAGHRGDGRATIMLSHFADPAWQREATAAEEDRIVGLLEAELSEGSLGIGVLVGYAPGTSLGEYLRVARLAASSRVPTYTHARDLVDFAPEARMDGAEELVRAAAETGAHMHYCHVNSTSLRHVDRVLALVDRVRREGAIVTTEAYPYGAGMTAIGAAFLAPHRLAERGLRPTDLVYAPTNERVRDVEHLSRLRAGDPGGLCIVHFFDETKASDAAVTRAALVHEDTMVAGDAMPLTWLGATADEVWPLPQSAITHPRTAGTFARSFRRLVGEGILGVSEFIRPASQLPAGVLAAASGGAARKGTLAVGADDDVVVFDPDAFRDRATYEASTLPSTGVRHLLVGGAPVVRDGALVLDARPGRPVRGPEARAAALVGRSGDRSYDAVLVLDRRAPDTQDVIGEFDRLLHCRHVERGGIEVQRLAVESEAIGSKLDGRARSDTPRLDHVSEPRAEAAIISRRCAKRVQRELAGMWQSRKAVPEQQLTVQAQVGVARKQRRLRELKGIRHRHFGEDGQVGNGRVMRQATLVVQSPEVFVEGGSTTVEEVRDAKTAARRPRNVHRDADRRILSGKVAEGETGEHVRVPIRKHTTGSAAQPVDQAAVHDRGVEHRQPHVRHLEAKHRRDRRSRVQHLQGPPERKSEVVCRARHVDVGP